MCHMNGDYEIGTQALDLVDTFGTVGKRLAGFSDTVHMFALPNVTVYPSTASVPISILLYDDFLLISI